MARKSAAILVLSVVLCCCATGASKTDPAETSVGIDDARGTPDVLIEELAAAAAAAAPPAAGAGAAAAAGKEHHAIFDVEFNTVGALGLQLSESLSVFDFMRGPKGQKLAAELSGWLKKGDVLLDVNDVPVTGMRPDAVAQVIRYADRPKVLRFRAVHGEDRVLEMALRQAEADSTRRGTLLVLSSDAPIAEFRFVLAEFGGQTGCWTAPIVMGSPPRACGEMRSGRGVANAIVLVHRGGCPFTDKGQNVQESGAGAMLVMNDDGDAIRMPKGNTPASIGIPSAMLSSTDAEALEALMRSNAAAGMTLSGRMLADGHTCAKKVAKQNATVESAMPSEAGAAGRVALTTAAGREIGVFEFLSALDFTGSLPPNATLRAAQPADACGGLSGVAPGDWVYTERGSCTFEVKRTNALAAGAGGILVANDAVSLFRMPPGNGRVPAWETFPSLLLTSDAGFALRAATADGAPLAAKFLPANELELLWLELNDLSSPESWPEAGPQRRKLYFRLCKVHHPDKSGGSLERFECLKRAYAAANEHYSGPAVEPPEREEL